MFDLQTDYVQKTTPEKHGIDFLAQMMILLMLHMFDKKTDYKTLALGGLPVSWRF